MMSNNKNFIPYKTLSKKLLKEVANGLKKIDKNNLKKIVLQGFLDYFDKNTSENIIHCSIKFAPLLQHPDSVVLAYFKKYPILNSDIIYIGGLARVYTESYSGANFPIPVVYLMPSHSKDILKHEKIHICQYLHDNTYPLSPEQKEIFLTKNLKDGLKCIMENKGRSAAFEFIINSVCYSTWAELEANYFSRKPEDLFEWMMLVYKSCQSIVKFEAMAKIAKWTRKDMKKAAFRFDKFCVNMEKEVKWVNDIVKSSSMESLHDFIFETHEEFEMQMIFGDYDYDEDYD